MDRSALFACALLIAPVALATGCGSKPPAAPADSAPLVLAELQAWSPGPWRHPDGHVAPTSLERPAFDFGTPPAAGPAEAESLRSRMSGPVIEQPPAAEAAAAPAEPQPAAAEPESVSGPELPGGATGPPAGESMLPDLVPELIDPLQSGPTPNAEPSAAPSVDTPTVAPPVDSPAARSPVPRTLEGMIAPPVAGRQLPGSMPLIEPRGQLPWAGPTLPSAEMQAVLDQSEQRLKEGFRLAERGALRLARAEFLAALELIAQANDMQRGTQFHCNSLAAGLVALEESSDFHRPRPIGKPLDLGRVVSGHRTQILAGEDLTRMSPVVAARRYYAFAQEQLGGATAGEARCSIALYGLGKLAMAGPQEEPARKMEFTAQAMVLYQAALMADRVNYRAANELGVILAENGHLPQSKKLFVHSVKLSPHPSTFRNLSIVHAKLGESVLSQQAMARSVEMERSGFRRSGPAVQWVDPLTFAGTTPPTTDVALRPITQQGAAASAAETKQPPVSTADKESSGWFPWKSKR